MNEFEGSFRKDKMEGKTDGILNTSRICRFCLSQAGVMSPIFEQGELNSLPLSSKIMAFISVQVYVNDGLPSLICHRCLYQVEKSYDFKTQCEASDAMLRKYLTAFQSNFQSKLPANVDSSESTPTFDSFNLSQFQKSMLHGSVFNDSPFKRKRGRPRKEENLIFYSSPVHQHLEGNNSLSNYPDDEIKIVDGIESVVTVVDPRSEMLSNSEDEIKMEADALIPDGESDKNETPFQNNNNEVMDSLAIAKAKAKKYMGVVIEVDENGTRNRRHLCKGCGKTFGHCSDLRKHVLVHTGERPFHCQICSKTFSRSTNLNKHMKVHTGQKPFFCTNCPKAFATKGDLQRHLIIHSGIKPFSCNFCNQCFSRKDKLTRHLKLHDAGGGAGKVNFKCTFCTAVYHSKTDLGHHIESMHSSELKAEDGDEEEGRSNSGEPFAVCKAEKTTGRDEDSSNDNKDNIFKVEKEESSPETNPEDGVESMVINIDPFQVDSDLSEPLNSWDNEKDKSDSETYMTSSNQDCEPEGKAKSCSNETGSYQCRFCRKKFAESSYLRSHLTTHSACKPHKCSLCEKSFTRRRELLRHESVHTGLKPFKCPTCSKAFSRKDKLARHEKIHNGLKKFACRICPSAAFPKVEELVHHHQSVHSEEAPMPNGASPGEKFPCELCSDEFLDAKSYEEHLTGHHISMNGIECNGERHNSEDEK